MRRASQMLLFCVKFISKNSNTLNPPIIIPCYGFHSRSTDLSDKPHSYASGLILLTNYDNQIYDRALLKFNSLIISSPLF